MLRSQRLAIPVSKPRNRVVQALVRGVLRTTTRAHVPAPRRRVDLDRLDLDQRVREVGEW